MLSLTHRRIRRRVETWVDGELTSPEARTVRRHLEECAGCSGEVELLGRIKASLGRLERRRPPALETARLRRWAEELAAGGLG